VSGRKYTRHRGRPAGKYATAPGYARDYLRFVENETVHAYFNLSLRRVEQNRVRSAHNGRNVFTHRRHSEHESARLLRLGTSEEFRGVCEDAMEEGEEEAEAAAEVASRTRN
jgi:hypothetical protein